MSEGRSIRGKLDVGGICGPIWFMGWLFTVDYLHLPFWKAVLAILLWPYYLGNMLGQ